MSPRTYRKLIGVLAALALAWPATGRADLYSDTLAAAAGEASREGWSEAADLLDGIADQYAEDYQLQLNRAWYRFQQGDYARARDAYELALAISGGSLDARLGLGWCAYQEGDGHEARQQFEAVLVTAPGHVGAREGLARLGTGHRFHPSAFLFYGKYLGHPWRDFQVGTTAGLDAVLADHLLVSAAYRYLYVRGKADSTAGTAEFDVHQHEAFAALGWTTSSWGIAAHGAYSHYDDTGNLAESLGQDSGMVGLSARYTWWADFLLSVQYSLYDDFNVIQGNVGTALPVADWLTLKGAFEFQYGDGRFWPSGAFEMLFHSGFGSLGLGGTVGTRIRPVDLDGRSMYNTTDRPSGTAWARAGFALGKGLVLHVSYVFERLFAASKTGDVETGYGHRVTAGLSMTLP